MNYKIASDEALLQYCRQENKLAFSELFDRYALKLYRLGVRYVKDCFVVEELALDLLLDIWERRHSLSIEEGSFSAYIFRAMHNKSMSHLRRTFPQILEIEQLGKDYSINSTVEADASLLLEEAERQYKTSLNTLTPQRRKVFELSRECDLSYKEIARELNLSINTVENHMQAALSTLRKQYKI